MAASSMSGKIFTLLRIQSVIGALGSAMLLGYHFYPEYILWMALVVAFNLGKVGAVLAMRSGKAVLLWGVCELGFIFSWWMGARQEVALFRQELNSYPEAFRSLLERKTVTPLGNNPELALAILLVLGLVWFAAFWFLRKKQPSA